MRFTFAEMSRIWVEDEGKEMRLFATESYPIAGEVAAASTPLTIPLGGRLLSLNKNSPCSPSSLIIPTPVDVTVTPPPPLPLPLALETKLKRLLFWNVSGSSMRTICVESVGTRRRSTSRRRCSSYSRCNSENDA